MSRKLLVSVLAVALTLCHLIDTAEARRARNRQIVIGTAALEPTQTGTAIDVSKAKGAITAIRIRAKKGPIEITGLRFVYSDDSFHTIDKTFTLRPGEATKLLDERDVDRFVNTVFINYKSADKPMVVEVNAVQSRDGSRMVRPEPAAPVAIPATSPRTDSKAAAAATPQKGAAETAAPSSPPPTQTAALPPPAPAPKPKGVIADAKSIKEGRDVMFGYQDVSGSQERAKLRVVSDVGKFHALRLRVTDSDLYVDDIEIGYSDGTSQAFQVNERIRAGQKSKWYAVNRAAMIKDVNLGLRAGRGSKNKARVELLGQYTEDWLAANGEGRSFNKGWVLLGSETAGAIGFDKDVVSIGDNRGDLTKLLLQVRERSITLREIRVVYQDGKDQVIRANDRLDPDQMAGPWELTTGSAVKEIVAVYRRRVLIGKGEGSPVVEFWGQH